MNLTELTNFANYTEYFKNTNTITLVVDSYNNNLLNFDIKAIFEGATSSSCIKNIYYNNKLTKSYYLAGETYLFTTKTQSGKTIQIFHKGSGFFGDASGDQYKPLKGEWVSDSDGNAGGCGTQSESYYIDNKIILDNSKCCSQVTHPTWAPHRTCCFQRLTMNNTLKLNHKSKLKLEFDLSRSIGVNNIVVELIDPFSPNGRHNMTKLKDSGFYSDINVKTEWVSMDIHSGDMSGLPLPNGTVIHDSARVTEIDLMESNIDTGYIETTFHPDAIVPAKTDEDVLASYRGWGPGRGNIPNSVNNSWNNIKKEPFSLEWVFNKNGWDIFFTSKKIPKTQITSIDLNTNTQRPDHWPTDPSNWKIPWNDALNRSDGLALYLAFNPGWVPDINSKYGDDTGACTPDIQTIPVTISTQNIDICNQNVHYNPPGKEYIYGYSKIPEGGPRPTPNPNKHGSHKVAQGEYCGLISVNECGPKATCNSFDNCPAICNAQTVCPNLIVGNSIKYDCTLLGKYC